jgi:hypothetical protein
LPTSLTDRQLALDAAARLYAGRLTAASLGIPANEDGLLAAVAANTLKLAEQLLAWLAPLGTDDLPPDADL